MWTPSLSHRRYFNPRVPCGTRPVAVAPEIAAAHISTHASLAGRDFYGYLSFGRNGISTHASLAGRDITFDSLRPAQVISTHASLAGRDHSTSRPAPCVRISTHASLAGRDELLHIDPLDLIYFNPRVPCGTRHIDRDQQGNEKAFQPTRPLRDATRITSPFSYPLRFQPTRPLRDATQQFFVGGVVLFISTHASLAGRDIALRDIVRYNQMISTHASLAGRDGSPLLPLILRHSSTHASLAGRDLIFPADVEIRMISTHASLAGRDPIPRFFPFLRG